MKHVRLSVVLVILLGILAACGDNTANTAPTAASNSTTAPANPTATTSDATAAPSGTGAVDKTKLSQELHIYAWGEYIPEEVPEAFEKEYGVKVIIDTYSSNEEMAAKIRAGNSGYDLVQPSDYMVALLAEGGYLAEINRANIPNLANILPENQGLYYDPDNKFSVPYLWGTTGIAYDKTAVTPAPDSWAVLFDPAKLEAFKGKTSMLNDEREVIGAAMRFLGKDLNASSAADLDAAKTALLAQKPFLAKYNSDNVYQDLASGEVVLAHSWNGYAGLAMVDNPNVEFVIPKEGGVIWQDTFAIVKDSPNQYTAEVFIDYMNRPEVAASVVDFTGFLTPNKAAVDLISDDMKPIYAKMNPDDATRKRLEWLRKGENSTAFAQVWSDVKSR